MKKYKRNFEEVSAVQVTNEWFDNPPPNNLHPKNVGINPKNRIVDFQDKKGISRYLYLGDWLITNSKGERYCCKPDTFEEHFEEISEKPEPKKGIRFNHVTVELKKGEEYDYCKLKTLKQTVTFPIDVYNRLTRDENDGFTTLTLYDTGGEPVQIWDVDPDTKEEILL